MDPNQVSNDHDITTHSIRQRWRKRGPETFPSPWSNAWGFDQYGLWQTFHFRDATQKMRFIAHGQFQMGSPTSEEDRQDHEIQHTVTISKGFWLGETPVSQALWQAVMANNPSAATETAVTTATEAVNSVTWNECQIFCQRLAEQLAGVVTKLPTEAQWEYACRGGTSSAFASDIASIDAPNPWGLQQMHGNVWEWCEDGLRQYTDAALTDPAITDTTATSPQFKPTQQASTLRIIRGGSHRDPIAFQRSAARFGRPENTRSSNLGFRLCIL